MEMILQPLAGACFVSGQPFAPGDRIVSYLVRAGAAGQVARYDVLESRAGGFTPEGTVACRWVQVHKPKAREENPERALKLTAEGLFLTLADPATEPTPETTRLVQFLAILLERKKLIRPRGRNPDGTKELYEHGRTKEVYEVPVGEATPEFFVAVQGQLGALGLTRN
jgi:hypothetical protein